MEMKDRIDAIRELTRYSEALMQLAEEASELAQAALKYSRALGTGTPTDVSPTDARERMIEETADVMLTAAVCGIRNTDTEPVMAAKVERWMRRLEAAQRR